MRVSLSWLKELVPVAMEAAELAERLTMVGLAVENMGRLTETVVEGVVTARVEDVKPHPNADKLVICRVTTGDGQEYQVVTGANNVTAGCIVPLALPGARVGELKIKKAVLRGVESAGMLCSGEEMGLDEKIISPASRNGILLLPPDTPLGKDIREILGLDDVILELELTPNRADCLSMIGVAREVAALVGEELRLPPVEVEKRGAFATSDLVDMKIEAPDLCHRYLGWAVRGVTIAPSPLWMQRRLMAAGVRPINNIVDVTNYVLMEMGQPLHAFDLRTLQGPAIIVRRAREGEKMITLDGVERVLSSDMLVIADAERPVALAGIMGGENTEVREDTRDILIEAAWFLPVSIRRTSRKLGLRSESSQRFEKGVDKEGVQRAAARAARLMVATGGGEAAASYTDLYPVTAEKREISFRPERISFLLGAEIPVEESKKILTSLGFGVEEKGDTWQVRVPSHRQDVALEEDLVEEVARFYGYDRIPVTVPGGLGERTGLTPAQKFRRLVRQVVSSSGFREIVTMSFINPVHMDNLRWPEDSPLRQTVVIQNPLSEEQRVMRTSLLPGLLQTAALNVARGERNLFLFEMGRTFHPRPGEKLPEEREMLAFLACGREERGWWEKAAPVDFYYLKGVLERLFRVLGIEASFRPDTDPALHPGRTAVVIAGGERCGVIGELHPEVGEKYGLPERVQVAWLDMEKLQPLWQPVAPYQPLPRFPAVDRDLAVVVPETVPAADLLAALREAGGELLVEVELFDLYRGSQIPPGHVSMAFSLRFQAPDRTLTDEEVNERHEAICQALAERFQARLR